MTFPSEPRLERELRLVLSSVGHSLLLKGPEWLVVFAVEETFVEVASLWSWASLRATEDGGDRRDSGIVYVVAGTQSIDRGVASSSKCSLLLQTLSFSGRLMDPGASRLHQGEEAD